MATFLCDCDLEREVPKSDILLDINSVTNALSGLRSLELLGDRMQSEQ